VLKWCCGVCESWPGTVCACCSLSNMVDHCMLLLIVEYMVNNCLLLLIAEYMVNYCMLLLIAEYENI